MSTVLSIKDTMMTDPKNGDRTPRLLFVHKQDSGLILVLRAIITGRSASSSECQLCATKFSSMGPDPKVDQFVSSLGMQIDFTSNEDLVHRSPAINIDAPSAFVDDNGRLELLVSKDEMISMANIDQLMETISERLKERRTRPQRTTVDERKIK